MKPAIAFSSVDFPHPDGPMTMIFSRGSTPKLTPPTAIVNPLGCQ